MSHYILTVGLEVHAELKTQTKMFCNSKNDPDETHPNVNICPVCMGHPGTLPTINKEAVKHVLKVGIALGGKLADFTEFDRKNYFYPDIPKGYQLSQYQFPLVTGGVLNGVAITRVHLEEDTATSLHERGDYSLIDFNRAGVPLMELVTEPVIRSAKEAGDFARELQLLLKYLGVSDANMEKGEMRVEANISVALATEMLASAEERRPYAETRGNLYDPLPRPSASSQRSSAVPLGTKVEVKNLNSFKAVERAIEYEVKRQTEALQLGEKVIQETRGWDETAQKTFSQRRKEESHDYRYFPDPDLPKLRIGEIPEFAKAALEGEMPELPSARRLRYANAFRIKKEDILIFIDNPGLASFFEAVCEKLLKDAKAIGLASSYLTSDVIGLWKKEGGEGILSIKFTPEEFSGLIGMITQGLLSSRGAKDTLAVMWKERGAPSAIAEKLGVLQKSDEGALLAIVGEIISAHPKVVADYKGGKEASLQFLVGQGMKLSRGSANPELLRALIQKTVK